MKRITSGVPIFFAASSPTCARRPVITTLAPSCTNLLAIDQPIPTEPPVTIATLPFKRSLIFKYPQSFYNMCICELYHKNDAFKGLFVTYFFKKGVINRLLLYYMRFFESFFIVHKITIYFFNHREYTQKS